MTPANAFLVAARHRRRKKRMVFLGVAILAVLSLLGYQLWAGYQATMRGAGIETRNYAATIETRLDATLRRADADLLHLVRTLPLAALSKQAVPRYARELNDVLDSRVVNFEELEGLRIFDADGDLLYTSASATTARANVADRSHFRLLRDNPQAGLVFSEVLAGRTAQGRRVLVAGRSLTDAQGIFRGVVFSVIAVDEFEKLFKSLDIGPHGVVSIRRSDNFAGVVRWPPLAAEVNKELPPGTPTREVVSAGQKKGTFEFAASSDGVFRIYSFRVLDRYPFYVSAAMAHADVLANWRKTALAVGISGLLLLGLLANFLYRLWRSEAREVQMLAELAASGDRIRLLASVFEHSSEAIMISDHNNRILETNPAFSRLTGYGVDEVRGQDPRILSAGRGTKEEREAMWQAIRETGCWQGEMWDKCKDGSCYPKWLVISTLRGGGGAFDYYISSFTDISERKAAADEIKHLAHHDVLTGLSNRYNLQGRLDQAVAMARREGSHVALMFLDMDRFKSINDTFGHQVGDGLLKEVAKRLVSSVRESDVVARLGGDEFVVVLNKVDVSVVGRLAEKIRDVLAQPYDIDGHELHSTSSMGVAVFPDDGANADALMKNADKAMYRAKSAGCNKVKLFTADMNESAADQHSGKFS